MDDNHRKLSTGGVVLAQFAGAKLLRSAQFEARNVDLIYRSRANLTSFYPVYAPDESGHATKTESQPEG